MARRESPDRFQELQHHLPPQSVEAEEAILSALLVGSDYSALLDVIEVLTPEDFYRSAHQKIFSAVSDLFAKNEPIDVVTLANMLQERSQLEDIGGASYLAYLMDAVPLAINAEHYARIVHSKAVLRRLITQANEIAKRCFEDAGNVEDVIDFAESAIYEVSQNRIKPAFYPISKIIESNIDALEERQGSRALVTGVPSGFLKFDEMTGGLQPCDLIILAARPGMGKTSLALNLIRHAAVEQGVAAAMFSLEMSKEQLSLRMLSSEARIDSGRMRGGFITQEEWIRITEAAGVLTEAQIFIDDSPDISAMEIRAKSRRLKMDKGVGLIVVDYLQLMRVRHQAERRDLEIAEISKSLKALAKELSVPVLALSQLNRKLEERSDKRPQLADLRESGALEQDADVVAFIYRDEIYNKDENNPHKGTAELILAKQRNGPTGSVSLTFLNAYTRFENPAFEP